MKPRAKLTWKPTGTLGASMFFLAFGSMALVVFLVQPDKKWSHWIGFAFYLAWTCAALFGTIYGLRTRVEADENGIRWRDWRGVWRTALWSEISDFHRRTSKSESSATHIVETPHGNPEFGLEAIAQRIAERAINASMREWEVKDERLIDTWPRRFEFCPSGRNNAAIISLLGILASLILVAALLIWWLPPRGELVLHVWFLAYVAPVLLLPILPLVIWFFVWARAREAQRFRGQSVEISPQRIVFEGATRLEFLYSQIEPWHWIQRGRTRFLQIKSAETTIEIPSFIVGFAALCRIVERFSGAPLVEAGEEFSTPGSAVRTLPDGTLSFNFYDLTVRMMVCLLCGMGILMTFLPLLFRFSDPEIPLHDETPGLLGIPLFFAGLLLHECFRRAQLCLT